MNERSADLRVRRHDPGQRVLETFDDGGFPGAIDTNDESEWGEEFDGLARLSLERTNAHDLHLIDGRHDGNRPDRLLRDGGG